MLDDSPSRRFAGVRLGESCNIAGSQTLIMASQKVKLRAVFS